MLHFERRKKVLFDVLLERLSAYPLHDVTGDAHPVIGVGGDGSGNKYSLRLVADEEVAQGDGRPRIGHDDVADFFFKSTGVGHQVAQGDGTGKGRSNLKI